MGTIRCALCALLLASLASATAGASGFMISKMGGDLSGPTEPNAAAVFWNPAAIGAIDGTAILLDANMAWRTMDFKRSWPGGFDKGARPDDPGQMSLMDTLPMVAVTARPGQDWVSFGLAVYVPFGHRSDWPAYHLEAERNLGDEGEAIPPQAFHSLTGGIKTIYTSAAVSLRIPGTDWLWFGFNGSWIYTEIDSSRVMDFSPMINESLGFDFAGPELAEYSGTVKLDFAGHSLAAALGLYAQPLDFLRIGLSFTSGSKLVLPGTTRISLPPMISSLYGSEQNVRSHSYMHMDLPPALRLGVHWDVTEWMVFRVVAEYVHWQVYEWVRIHELKLKDSVGPVAGLADFSEFSSARNYKNALDVRAGFRFFPLPWWMIFCGAGYDTNAVPEKTTTPDLYDSEKVGAALGTQIQIIPFLEALVGRDLGEDEMFALAIGVTWVHFLENRVRASEADPPITGTYHSEVILLNTNLEARF